ncbi:sodium:calcium antiporter [Halobaculum rubrum]|uniref:sodium:calcium antiporter n=1 Tax=Halobaculum rubrum TaxID=2872158 RepID=UPI001EFEF963|nr:hypothetical protein [Halobaculum rubrum]
MSLAAGASPFLVGAELVAVTAVIGTSLPEIAVSAAAVRRGALDIAVGNVLGSNVFNTFAVMGVPSLIAPVAVPESVRRYALPAMLLATLPYYFITQDGEPTVREGGRAVGVVRGVPRESRHGHIAACPHVPGTIHRI